jgi:4-hydroxy-tetrahydrodipicolinate reductase
MKIGIIGYGKMGKTIEKIAKDRNHVISGIVDPTNDQKIENLKDMGVDVAIEFTAPEAAADNIKACINHGIPVVSGSTGWLSQLDEIKSLCNEKNGSFFYASNFSLGVNLFFQLNKQLAKMMNQFKQYEAEIEEIHHTQKVDKPSGTAITLAEGLIDNHSRYAAWELDQSPDQSKLAIHALREPDVPGTHTIRFTSEEDIIEIKHTAKGRHGFALGAVKVAEWLPGKTGFYTMDDYLKF